AKKLLPYIPNNAGILLVPCCRGGSAFTQGAEGTFSESTGASQDSARWGVPLLSCQACYDACGV
ncbi:hypothetical protein RD077_005201, partial [Escherichia coli]|nr:hypothetical protein [Escherichia coli]